jgi:UDP-GlcNAc3NAcA epimerase
MRILSIVGNRPQFIKSGPVSVALREKGIEEVVVHTGQHYDRELSQVFFDELGLTEPAHRLDLRTADVEVMRGAIAEVVRSEGPDVVLVFGDTNSTLAGAQAAADDNVPVAHVEAGLRSGDLSMPEEHNRIAVDRVADVLLAPDERSRAILEGEGVHGRIEVVGDVMADACFTLAPLARERSTVLPRLGLDPGAYALLTLHREANVAADRLRRILDAVGESSGQFVFPAHPRTRGTIETAGIRLAPAIRMLEPLGYLDLAALASQARVIVTDSGGLQKEAYWYGVPCVTTRPSTEWVDTVEAGANVLVDDDVDAIRTAVMSARFPAGAPPLYGDGHAAPRTAAALARLYRS